jgi:linoleoyl-CoA desaturase
MLMHILQKTIFLNMQMDSMVFKTSSDALFIYCSTLASLMVFHQETWQIMIGFSIVGLAMAGIGMNVMHDANHNAYSAKSNGQHNLVGYSLNMVGGTVFQLETAAQYSSSYLYKRVSNGR